MNNSGGKKSISNRKPEPRGERAKEDLQLIKRCKKGDEAAFNALVTKYQKKVYLVALGMVKNPEDAMDIAQEGFVKVHRYLGKFQGTSSFYTWLYRIVVNLCIDHLRKSGKYDADEYDERIHNENGIGSVDGPALVDGNPAKNISRRELADKMREAIDSLAPYHRAVIMMREVEGMSYSDMAKALQVSKGTVMSRLHHARNNLQAALQPYLEGELTVES